MKKILFSILLVLALGVAVACKPVEPPTPPVDYQALANEALEQALIVYADGDSATSVTKDVSLVNAVTLSEYEIAISWATSNANSVSASGKVKRDLYEDKAVTLTATSSIEGKSATKGVAVVVKVAVYSVNLSAALGYAIGDSATSVTQNLHLNRTLPAYGTPGSVEITWETSDPDVVALSGKVTRPVGDDVDVTLTATGTFGTITETKEFVVTVKGLPANPWLSVWAALDDSFGIEGSNQFVPALPGTVIVNIITDYLASDDIVLLDVVTANAQNALAAYVTLLNNAFVYVGSNSSGIPFFAYNLTEEYALWIAAYVSGGNLRLQVWIDEAVVVNVSGGWSDVYEQIAELLEIEDISEILPSYGEEVFIDGNYLPDIYIDVTSEDPEGDAEAYIELLLEAGYVAYGEFYVYDLGEGYGLFVVAYEYNGYLEIYVFVDEYDPNVEYDPWADLWDTLNYLYDSEDFETYLPKLDEASAVNLITNYYNAYDLVSVILTVEDSSAVIDAYLALFDQVDALTYTGLDSAWWQGAPAAPVWIINIDNYSIRFQVAAFNGYVRVDVWFDDPWVEVEVPDGVTWEEAYEQLAEILGLAAIEELLPSVGEYVIVWDLDVVYLDVEVSNVEEAIVAYSAVLEGLGYVLVDEEYNVWALDLLDGTSLYVAVYEYDGYLELGVSVEVNGEIGEGVWDLADAAVNVFFQADISILLPHVDGAAVVTSGAADATHYDVSIVPTGDPEAYYDAVVAAFEADAAWIFFGLDSYDGTPIYYQPLDGHPGQGFYANPWYDEGETHYYLYIAALPPEPASWAEVYDRIVAIQGYPIISSLLPEYPDGVSVALDEGYLPTLYLDISVEGDAATHLAAYVALLQTNPALTNFVLSQGQYTFAYYGLTSYSYYSFVAYVYNGMIEIGFRPAVITTGVTALISGYNRMSFYYGIDLTSVLPVVTPTPNSASVASNPANAVYQITYAMGNATNRTNFNAAITEALNLSPEWTFIFKDASDQSPWWYHVVDHTQDGTEVWILLNVFTNGNNVVLYAQEVLGYNKVEDWSEVWGAYDVAFAATGINLAGVFDEEIVGTYYLNDDSAKESYPYVTATGSLRFDYFDPAGTLWTILVAKLEAAGYTVAPGSSLTNTTYTKVVNGYLYTFHIVTTDTYNGSYFEVTAGEIVTAQGWDTPQGGSVAPSDYGVQFTSETEAQGEGQSDYLVGPATYFGSNSTHNTAWATANVSNVSIDIKVSDLANEGDYLILVLSYNKSGNVHGAEVRVGIAKTAAGYTIAQLDGVSWTTAADQLASILSAPKATALTVSGDTLTVKFASFYISATLLTTNFTATDASGVIWSYTYGTTITAALNGLRALWICATNVEHIDGRNLFYWFSAIPSVTTPPYADAIAWETFKFNLSASRKLDFSDIPSFAALSAFIASATGATSGQNNYTLTLTLTNAGLTSTAAGIVGEGLIQAGYVLSDTNVYTSPHGYKITVTTSGSNVVLTIAKV